MYLKVWKIRAVDDGKSATAGQESGIHWRTLWRVSGVRFWSFLLPFLLPSLSSRHPLSILFRIMCPGERREMTFFCCWTIIKLSAFLHLTDHREPLQPLALGWRKNYIFIFSLSFTLTAIWPSSLVYLINVYHHFRYPFSTFQLIFFTCFLICRNEGMREKESERLMIKSIITIVHFINVIYGQKQKQASLSASILFRLGSSLPENAVCASILLDRLVLLLLLPLEKKKP